MKTVSPNNNKPPAAPKGKWWWPILGIQSDPPARHPLWKIRETGVQLWKADEAHAIAAWGVTFVDAGGQTQTGFFGSSIEAHCENANPINDPEQAADGFVELQFRNNAFHHPEGHVVTGCGVAVFLPNGRIVASECVT